MVSHLLDKSFHILSLVGLSEGTQGPAETPGQLRGT